MMMMMMMKMVMMIRVDRPTGHTMMIHERHDGVKG